MRTHPRYAGWIWVGMSLSPAGSPEWRDRLAAAARTDAALRPVGIEPLVSSDYIWIVSPPGGVAAAIHGVRHLVERVNACGYDEPEVVTGAVRTVVGGLGGAVNGGAVVGADVAGVAVLTGGAAVV